jgi:hypothetical protein
VEFPLEGGFYIWSKKGSNINFLKFYFSIVGGIFCKLTYKKEKKGIF